ncbi:MAG: ankyrin repeat domain-containing protein, partial [Gammaproteobacteria bacterium]|nr:ankyrin repeat domain-containing protein [Gammaproteobacteria bacterium]
SGGAPSDVWNRYGVTPLHLAAETGALDVVTALVGAGADLSVRDADEYTPLHRAVARGELETVEVLLSAGADPSAEADLSFVRSMLVNSRHFSRTPLHLAAARADAAATEALLRARADPNVDNLMYLAIEEGAVAVVDALLGAGAELPSHALYVAIDQGAWTIVEPLLRAGANPSVRGSFEKTLLHEAAENGIPVEVVELLLRAGLNPNARQDGDFTPLHMTAHNLVNPGAMAETLIAAGADLNARAVTGETPLAFAERFDNGALAAVLRRHGGQL